MNFNVLTFGIIKYFDKRNSVLSCKILHWLEKHDTLIPFL